MTGLYFLFFPLYPNLENGFFDIRPKGVAELRTPIYITFVIAIVTVATVMLTVLTVKMIFAINTVMKTTAAANRSRRIRICWKRQVIN